MNSSLRWRIRWLPIAAVFAGLATAALSQGTTYKPALASNGISPLAPQGAVLFQDNFDDQSSGPVVTGEDRYHFNDVGLAAHGGGSVIATSAPSAPNALQISASGGGSSYQLEQLVQNRSGSLPDLTLQFDVYLSNSFSQPAASYMVIGQILPNAQDQNTCGQANLVMAGSSNALHVDYKPSTGDSQTLYTDSSLGTGSWHVVDLVESLSGSITVYIDDHQAGTQSGINFSGCTIGGLTVGMDYAPSNWNLTGSLEYDSVYGISSAAFVQGSPLNKGTQALGYSGVDETGNAVTVEDWGLQVNADGGGRAYAYKQYPVSFWNHQLSFGLAINSGATQSASDYLIAAQTAPAFPASANAGKVDLLLAGPNFTVQLLYWDSSGNEHAFYTGDNLGPGSTNSICLIENVDAGTGSLILIVNGKTIVNAAGLDTGSQPVDYFGLGLLYGTPDSAVRATLGYTNIMTTTGDLAQALPPPHQGSPTPTPTVTGTPTCGCKWGTPGPTVTTTPTPTPTPSGGQGGGGNQSGGKVIFSKTFDGDKPGPLHPGKDAHDFGWVTGGTNLSVDRSRYAYSTPNMLAVTVHPGSSAFGFRSYQAAYHVHTLSFQMTLQSGFHVASGDYVTLAATQYGGEQVHPGTIELNLTSNRILDLTVWDVHGKAWYFTTNEQVPVGRWVGLSLTEVTGSSGQIRIALSGNPVAVATGLHLPSSGVSSFAIGNIYSAAHYKAPGAQILYDNIVTRGK